MAADIERGTVTISKNDDELRELQVEHQSGEVRQDVEHMEPYGFSSEPYTDKKTDAITFYTDESHELGFVMCVADRRFRVKSLKTGEVVIYDDKKRHIYLKRDCIDIDGVDDPINIHTKGDINITSNANINIKADSEVNVTADTVNVKASTSTVVTCPQNTINGPLTVTELITGQGGMIISGGSGAQITGNIQQTQGNYTTTGSIHSDGDTTAGSISLKDHTHTGDSGGSTSAPR